MQTLVKFHLRRPPANALPGGHPIIAQTMGKLGLVERSWPVTDNFPQDQEFWRVQIVKETGIGTNKGAFILRPVAKVSVADIRYLQPGFFDTELVAEGNTLLVRPRMGIGETAASEVNYLLPLELRRALFLSERVSAIVVDLGGEYWDLRKP